MIYQLYDPEEIKKCKESIIKGNKNDIMISPAEFIDKILKISKFNIKLAAFFSILYLTGSDIAEILIYKYRGKNEEFKHIIKPGIMIKDFTLEKDPIVKTDWFCIKTRKEKRFDVKGIHYKYCRCEYVKDSYCYPLITLVDDYLENILKQGHNPEQPIFKFGYRYAFQMLQKYLNVNPLTLKTIRARHLCKYESYDAKDFKRFFGENPSATKLRLWNLK